MCAGTNRHGITDNVRAVVWGPNSMNYAENQGIEQRYTETVHGEIKKRTETICYVRKEVDPSS